MVQAGSVVTCQITASTTYTNGPEDVVALVSSLLASSGYGVQNATLLSGGFLDALAAVGTNYPFQVSMDVVAPADFADPADLVSIVANAFYQETGSYPTSSTWSKVSGPGGAVTTGTPLAAGGIGGAASGVVGSLSSALQSTLGAGSNLLIGLAVLLVAILLIVGWAPNTEKVGRAAANFA